MNTLSFTPCAGRRRRIALLLLASAGSLVAVPASAQFFGGYNGPGAPPAYGQPGPVFRGYQRPIPPDDIVDRLEDRGFEDVSSPRFDGSTYTVTATSPRGLRVRLVIDAFRGNVVDRSAFGRADDDDDVRSPVGRRPEGDRGWFGNNLPPPNFGRRPEPDFGDQGRTARIEPPGAIETAPLEPPRSGGAPGEVGRPVPREAIPSVRTPSPDASGSAQRPARPARPSDSASAGRIEGGNPDAFNGEQRKPATAVTPPAAPPRTATVSPQSSVPSPQPNASVPTEPKPPQAKAEPPASGGAPTADVRPPAAQPKAEGLSPIRPLRPQAAPETGAEARPDRTVRIIGGVTPVPAAPSSGGSITADSDSVKP